VWLSSQPLDSYNVHERCNLGARQRWGIETSFLVEKCQGYHYEYAFSYTWNAMKGYHYLMRLAHLVNALALATKRVASQVRTLGVVDRTLSSHALAVATRIAAPPAYRPNGHRGRRKGSRQGLLCAAEVVTLKKWASVPWQSLILAATSA
jgi:hypothetical protein